MLPLQQGSDANQQRPVSICVLHIVCTVALVPGSDALRMSVLLPVQCGSDAVERCRASVCEAYRSSRWPLM